MSDEINNEEVDEVENVEPEQQEENGRVRSIQHLSGMFEKWFLDYASYVILERAVPYVNDGLKPVQRRILHAMKEMDDGRFNKVANIVGSTMAYHPHGDASIKDALVQLGQKNLLVDCQGNWGNILTGDDAAAGRYIEARLSKFALEVAFNPKTTNWKLSYDGRKREPVTLPVKFPLLLAQGVEGIAVGLASKILPHNFNELLDACVAYLKNEDFVLYPDFPTGGIIANKDDLPAIYESGVGKIKIRGKIEIEKGKGGKDRMVITEIPYTMIGANIGKFLNDVYGLVESKATSDITDITNQSSKEGIRIVLELKKGADIEALENLLYKKTKLEDTFGVNMLAVADGRPETMGVVPIIRHHVKFQYEIATRKYQTLLAKEQDKKEIQEGLIRACNVIDLIIEILRGSRNIKDAKACLTDGNTDHITFKNPSSKIMAQQLNFTDRQAQAILEMRLYKLIGLEIEALMKEHDETLENIAKYEDILEHRSSMAKVIIKELTAFKKAYGKERKTVIDNLKEAVVAAKKIEEQDVVFLMDRFGYAKIVDTSVYERNKEAANAEYRHIFTCKNTDKICIFTDKGQMHLLKVLDLPYGKFRDKGTPIDNLCNYDSREENVVYLAGLEHVSSHRMLFGTKYAMIKVVDGMEFVVAKKTTAATKLGEEDEVLTVCPLEENDTLVMASKKDMFLRIDCAQIPQKKKGAVGVRGMKLAAGDELKSIHVLHEGEEKEVEVKGKPVALNRLHVGNRDTKGVKK